MYLGKFLWDHFKAHDQVKHGSATVLDEVLVVIMRAPRSYTGEDVVEVHGHGGPLIVQAICEALTQAGARMAEPGEFTKRAFCLNSQIDFTRGFIRRMNILSDVLLGLWAQVINFGNCGNQSRSICSP